MCVCARDSMGVLVGGGVHACVCFYENTPFGAVACYFTSALLQTLSLGYRYPLFLLLWNRASSNISGGTYFRISVVAFVLLRGDDRSFEVPQGKKTKII